MLLLLAGTSEARELAEKLAEAGVPTLASLAGATRDPGALPVPTRRGGFGGTEGFRAEVARHGIRAIVDATHPFAWRISHRTAALAESLGLPYLQLLRPGWQPGPGDNWVVVEREEEVACHIPAGATVFVASGRQTLRRFACLTGRRLICRQIDPPDGPFPFPNGEFLVGRPPFSVSEERELFERLGVDWLVVKNAGGMRSTSKLVAARELGLKVAMIKRPKQPRAARVGTVAEAFDWIKALSW